MRSRSLIATFLVVSLMQVTPAFAYQKSQPWQKPIITKIIVTKTSSKTSSIRVYALRNNPQDSGVSPAPTIIVEIGKKTCKISSSYGSCVIQKVKYNSNAVVFAYQTNKFGSGQKVKKSIKASAKTVTYRMMKGSSKTKRAKGLVLATARQRLGQVQSFNSSASVRNIRAIRASAFIKKDNSSDGFGHRSFDDVNQVAFDFSGAVALAKPESTQGNSGFYKLESDGSQSDPLVNGNIAVQNFYIAPNDDIYAVLTSRAPLATGGASCIIVKIDSTTGVPTCIDENIDYVNWYSGNIRVYAPAFQFDANSNVYYSGQEGSNTVLRKYSNGSVTDLINQNMTVRQFYVTPDAHVIFCGSTGSSNTDWIRRLAPNGSVTTIKSGVGCSWLQKFADGNLWMGAGAGGPLKLDLSTKKLLRSPWSYKYANRNPEIDLDEYSWENRIGNNENNGFYGSAGTNLTDSFIFPSTKETWVLAGQGNEVDLVRFTPSLLIAQTSLKNYTMGRRVLNTLILTGTDYKDTNRLILYDTKTGNETVVFDGSNEIEIYDMVFVAGTNTLMFSGLRFSDNQYVVGKVSL